jgi:hypothetical protein
VYRTTLNSSCPAAVEKNLEEQHRKLEKDLRQRVEAAQNDIWSNAQKLIAAAR